MFKHRSCNAIWLHEGKNVCLLFRPLSRSILGTRERTRWWRSRRMWSTSLSMDTSGSYLQTQKCMQNTNREPTGVPDQKRIYIFFLTWKRIYRPLQNSVGWRNYGGKWSVSWTGSALGRWGNWSRGPIPTLGQLSESEEKHLRLRVKQMVCGSLNGMKIRQSLPQPYIPWTGM